LLHNYIYRLQYARRLGRGAADLEWARAVAMAVPIHVLKRPDDMTVLPDMCAAIEDRL
jgi:hypothetical protein